MSSPLVSVICLCFNQAHFVKDAIRSVLDQHYPYIELIVVDDASTDNSVELIGDCIKDVPSVRFFPLPSNVGSCRAFNHALAHATGEYIIDLAADDMLMPERVSEGVRALQAAGDAYGVHFADAWWVDETGRELRLHSKRFPHETIPQGNVYRDLIERFFICSAAMMFRTNVIRSLGGYDEQLAYEDFDIQIRSSRKYLYCYTPQPLVKKRIVKNSMSERQFKPFSRQQVSTFRVCEKILELNRSSEEQKALSRRILYEMRVCLRLFHFPLLTRYARLWFRNRGIHY